VCDAWSSPDQFDDGGAADDAEDETKGEEAEFACRHPVRIPRLEVGRARDPIARPA
jgi:hypothetical protein